MASKPKTPREIADKDIAVRAHQIWQDVGEPDDQADTHWEQARQDLTGRKPKSGTTKAPKAKP